MGDERRDVYGDVAVEKKKSGNDSEKIRAEVEGLIKKGELSPEAINSLYRKYDDKESILAEILKNSMKHHKKRVEKARELAQKAYKKFSSGNVPYHEILNRMVKYKIDNKWSDQDYDEFRKELAFLLTGVKALEIDYNQNLGTQRSRINRALGNTRVTTDEGLRIKDSEQPTLAKIISMYDNTASLHRSVFMASLMYTDCALMAMTGEYKKERHIASNYIHPLLACMFLPKFDLFEIHMLYSNFGAIMKARSEKRPIVNEPDALLLHDISYDPNDVVCETNSPIADIEKRYRVQIALWEIVLKLRNGNYYEASPINEFITLLNTCRNNLYDNTDLAYNQDEGAILRRLMSVFALRPTIIMTKTLQSLNSYTTSPFGFSMSMGMGGMNNQMPAPGCGSSMFSQHAYMNQPMPTVTSIPMINICIPPYNENAGNSDNVAPQEKIDIRNATQQTIWINENKTIVPKEQSIIYSKEVLIFYVNRRVQTVQIKTFSNPLAFSQLPMTMSSFEKLNPYPVGVPPRLRIGKSGENYDLRSVVAVTETEIAQGEKSAKIITGCTGLIMSHRNPGTGDFTSKYYLYDPFAASLPIQHPSGSGYLLNKPISLLPPYFPEIEESGYTNASWFQRAETNGTIYIYAKDSGYSPYENISLV